MLYEHPSQYVAEGKENHLFPQRFIEVSDESCDSISHLSNHSLIHNRRLHFHLARHSRSNIHPALFTFQGMVGIYASWLALANAPTRAL